MNKTYKSIYSEATGTYVAVSEHVKSRGKRSSSSKLLGGLTTGAKAVASAFLLVGLSGVVMHAYAHTGTGGGTGSGTAISHDSSKNCSQANAVDRDAIAIGCGSVAEIGSSFYNRENPDNNNIDHDGLRNPGSYYSVAVGTNAKAVRGSVAFGHGAEAGNSSTGLAVAIGSQARATNVASVAIGPAALSTGNTGLALGCQSSATADFAQAIGNVARASGLGSLAVGHSATAQGKRSIAIGAADIDAAGNTGDQQGTVYEEGEQTLATGRDAIALGAAANATSDFALAIGAHSLASGLNSTAMGYQAEAVGENTFASGVSAKATGDNSFALGADSISEGARSFAMGPESQAIGENALALGSLSVANQKNSIAVGVGAQANFADSVALGSGSSVDHLNSIAIGTQSTTNNYTSEEAFLYASGAAGAIATGAVSIGNGLGTAGDGTNERRLQNVAAGGLDTDAVNVSQLKMHKGITDKAGQDLAASLGGDSTFDPITGAVTNPTYKIGDTTYNDVGSALLAARTVVAEGKNIAVVATKGDDGESIFTVATRDDLVLTSVTTGNTVMNTGGVTVSGGANGPINLSNTGLTAGSVVISSADGINAGDKKITNVAAGTEITDAVNLGQLNEVGETANKGWDLVADGVADSQNIAPGGTATFAAGKNLDVERDGATITYKTSDDVEFTNVNVTEEITVAGNTTINDGGITTNHLTSEEIFITKEGDTINVGEILDTGITFTGDDGLTTERKLGSTLDIAGGDNISTSVSDGQVQVALNKDLTGLDSVETGSINVGNGTVVVSNGQFTIGGDTLIDMGDNRVTNVADGVDAQDAVNVGQLDKVGETANKGWNLATEGEAGENIVPGGTATFAAGKNLEVARDGATITYNMSDDVEFTNIDVTEEITIAGETTINDGGITTNHLTSEEIFITNKEGDTINVGETLDTGITFIGDDGKETEQKLGSDLTIAGGDNISTSVSDGQVQVVLDKDLTGLTSVQTETINVGNGTLVAGNNQFTIGGDTLIDMGDNRVTNVADGVDAKDAVNVGQLDKVGETANKGWNLATEGEAGENIVPGGTATFAAGKNLDVERDGATIMYKTSDDVEFTNVNVTEEITIAGETTINDGGITTNHLTSEEIFITKEGDTINVGEILDTGITFTGDDGLTTERKLGSTLDIAGGDNISTSVSDGQVQVALNKDLTGLDSVETGSLNVGNGTLVAGNNQFTIGADTVIDMGGNTITNVGDGVLDSDAVNLGQLNDSKGELTSLGLDFAGNQGEVHKDLGEKLSIIGTMTDMGDDAASAENIRTVVNSAGDLEIQLSKDLTGLTSVQTETINVGNGTLVVGNNQFTIGGDTLIDMGDNRVTNVADGVDAKDAVNVGQLDKVGETANKGWNLAAVDTAGEQNIAPGGTATFAAGKNLEVARDGATVTYNMSDDVEFTTVNVSEEITVAGNTTINEGGITTNNLITENITAQTINSEEIFITNKEGDTINVGEMLDTGITFTGDDGIATEQGLGGALKIAGDNNITTSGSNGQIQLVLNPVLTGLTSVQTETINVGNDTLVAGNNQFTIGAGTAIDMGDNRVTNVAAGTETTDAVNLGQLDNSKGELTQLGLDFAGNQGEVHKDLGEKLTIIGTMTDMGDDAASAENIRTVVNAAGEMEIQLSKNLTALESVTTGNTVMDTDGIRIRNDEGDDLVTLNNQGLLIAGGPSVTMDGIDAGGLKITNVAAGTAPTDAVNFSQLTDLQGNVDDLGDRAVKYDGNAGDPKDTITLEGESGTRITNLADGAIEAGSSDAINGGQIHNMGESIAAGMGGASKFENGQLITELDVAGNTYYNVNDALTGVHGDLSSKIENVENIANAGWNVTDAEGNSSNIGPNGSVAFVGDSNISVAQTGANNAGRVEVSLNQDLNVNSVTATTVNATTVNASTVAIQDGPTINQNGINMAGKRITNVAPGEDGTDAVNIDQLAGVANHLGNQIGEVRRDLNRVAKDASAGTASAMAMANLPQAWRPGQTGVAAGASNYRGHQGYAIGVSSMSDNGKWVVKGSLSGSDRGSVGSAVGVFYSFD